MLDFVQVFPLVVLGMITVVETQFGEIIHVNSRNVFVQRDTMTQQIEHYIRRE